ncbi:MAG: aminotransferase class I/II-fold pyridoxal phosphate-dependent enzyme [Planctomycetes bacterium]|nr:aminotransferase class I/II-fold pyridoxal phosphate-dependent enzyme [Planctomycetota bacterium]
MESSDHRPANVLRHPSLPEDAGFETICAHWAEDRGAQRGAAAPPIYQTSTFVYPDAEAFEQRLTPASPNYDYTRVGNPTTAVLEQKLAKLERGSWCRCFASGMGAVSAAINACVKSGSHVVAVAHCYWPTRRYLRDYLSRFGVSTTFVDGCDPADFVAAFRSETELLMLESPTTGHFEVPEIEPIARAAGARGVTVLFDNSWATPYFLRPLELGCDLVVHSASKYIGGHSDLVAGALVGRDDELLARVGPEVELLGATLDPFAAWLLIRGLRTLGVRMEYHQKSALAVARMLEEHRGVECVNHPGLESHPQHAVAARQLEGYSSLFSFRPKEQSREAVHRILNRLRLFSIGVSWGGHESLAIGGTMFNLDPKDPGRIIRLHVGLESTGDLIADLRHALEI